jgi:hypothetical protein
MNNKANSSGETSGVRVCTGVYGCVRVCTGVYGCVRVCTGHFLGICYTKITIHKTKACLTSIFFDGQIRNLIVQAGTPHNLLEFYNYRRLHSSTAKLPPMTFLDQWNNGDIEVIVHPKSLRKVQFMLRIPKQLVTRVNQQAMRA